MSLQQRRREGAAANISLTNNRNGGATSLAIADPAVQAAPVPFLAALYRAGHRQLQAVRYFGEQLFEFHESRLGIVGDQDVVRLTADEQPPILRHGASQ